MAFINVLKPSGGASVIAFSIASVTFGVSLCRRPRIVGAQMKASSVLPFWLWAIFKIV
jgi:hypothetical protein